MSGWWAILYHPCKRQWRIAPASCDADEHSHHPMCYNCASILINAGWQEIAREFCEYWQIESELEMLRKHREGENKRW